MHNETDIISVARFVFLRIAFGKSVGNTSPSTVSFSYLYTAPHAMGSSATNTFDTGAGKISVMIIAASITDP